MIAKQMEAKWVPMEEELEDGWSETGFFKVGDSGWSARMVEREWGWDGERDGGGEGDREESRMDMGRGAVAEESGGK